MRILIRLLLKLNSGIIYATMAYTIAFLAYAFARDDEPNQYKIPVLMFGDLEIIVQHLGQAVLLFSNLFLIASGLLTFLLTIMEIAMSFACSRIERDDGIALFHGGCSLGAILCVLIKLLFYGTLLALLLPGLQDC